MDLPSLAILWQDGAPPATGAPAGTGSSFLSMLTPLLLCMVVFYIFIIGPERKQRKKREEMLRNLQKGARVVTSGGLHGTVAQVQDQVVTLQVADGVRMRVALSAIQQVLEEGAEEAAVTEKRA